MREDFKEFVQVIREGLASGEITVSKPLSDYDLAVTYAIGEIGKRRGYPCAMEIDELIYEMMDFAPELLKMNS